MGVKMNLPNKLTCSRLVMAPLFLVLYFLPTNTLTTILIVIVFALNELSDLLDGKIARSRGLVTDLGKVMDPFADVFSRITYFVCFTFVGLMPIICFVLILWRELAQMFLRMLLMGKGTAMPANIFGKAKAVLYAVCGALGVLYTAALHWFATEAWMASANTVLQVCFYLAAFASVASFVVYVVNALRSGALKDMTR